MKSFEVTSDSRRDWHRNIVSLRESVPLLSRFVENDEELDIVLRHEIDTKLTRDPTPIIRRPFEDTEIHDPIRQAIQWPFDHPCASRYSAGAFGIWYGAGSLETSIHETAHHFKINTLASAAASGGDVIYQERRVHLVHCAAMLVDLRIHCATEPALLDTADYSYCQALGAQLRAASQPGVITRSARHGEGEIVGVFAREALSNPRNVCYLTYSFEVGSGKVSVERDPGKVDWIVD